MRTLAIDLGTKRIGLAMSDEGGSWATPLDVLFVTDAGQALAPVAAIVRQEGVGRVVIGLPLNMDGTVGPMARMTLAWADRLRPLVGEADVVFVDERLSSFDAEQTLTRAKRAGAKLTRKGKKERLDAVAAAGFLQAFLDGGLPAIDIGAPRRADFDAPLDDREDAAG